MKRLALYIDNIDWNKTSNNIAIDLINFIESIGFLNEDIKYANDDMFGIKKLSKRKDLTMELYEKIWESIELLKCRTEINDLSKLPQTLKTKEEILFYKEKMLEIKFGKKI